MSDEELPTQCRVGMILGLGLSVGAVVGFAVGSVVALRLSRDPVGSVRGLFGRMAGRSNQVNFELLLQ
jgi:hypothetical protein